MFRWMLQIMAMLSDLIILGMSIMILYSLPWYFSIPAVYFMYRIWKNQGGHIAWTRKGREKFMKNAKMYGL